MKERKIKIITFISEIILLSLIVAIIITNIPDNIIKKADSSIYGFLPEKSILLVIKVKPIKESINTQVTLSKYTCSIVVLPDSIITNTFSFVDDYGKYRKNDIINK